jgi:hypothetical protein
MGQVFRVTSDRLILDSSGESRDARVWEIGASPRGVVPHSDRLERQWFRHGSTDAAALPGNLGRNIAPARAVSLMTMHRSLPAAVLFAVVVVACSGKDPQVVTTSATNNGRATETVETKIGPTEPITTVAPPPPTNIEPITTVPFDDARAARGLASAARCTRVHPRRALAVLQWTPAAEPGSAQRVEVTIFPDGFEAGPVEHSGLLPPGQSQLRWWRVHGQGVHFWRVLTRDEQGWVASGVSRFEGPLCAVDFQNP